MNKLSKLDKSVRFLFAILVAFSISMGWGLAAWGQDNPLATSEAQAQTAGSSSQTAGQSTAAKKDPLATYDRTMKLFEDSAKKFNSRMIYAGATLLFLLLIIQLIWSLGMMALKGKFNLTSAVGTMINHMVIALIFLALIGLSPRFIDLFINEWHRIGGAGAGTGPLDPGEILTQGFQTMGTIQKAIGKSDPGWLNSIGYGLLGIIISALVLICYILIAGQMALVQIKAYFWICVAPILLGFGSIKNFRDIATNTMKSSISMGAIILMVYVVAGVAREASVEFGGLMATFGNDNWTPLWAILAVMGMLAFAALQVPKFANDFFNGTVSGGVGEVMGAAIGAAAGAAAVAAGGAAVAKSTAGAATDQLAGVMKAAGAAMQDAGDHGRSGVGAFLHASGALAGAAGGMMADTGKSAVKAVLEKYNAAGEGTVGGKMADRINAGRGGSIANASNGGSSGAFAPGSGSSSPNVGTGTGSSGNGNAASLPSGSGAIGGASGSEGKDASSTAGPSLAESIRDLQGYVPDDSATVGVNANLGYHPPDDH